MSKAGKGKPKSKEHCENISKGMKGRPAPWCEGENHWMFGKGYLISGQNNHQYGKRGPLSPNFGKPTSDLQKQVAREVGRSRTGPKSSNYGKPIPDDVKDKLRASNIGKKRSEEAKANMRKPRSPEGKAAIAASNRARAEKKRAEKSARLLVESESLAAKEKSNAHG